MTPRKPQPMTIPSPASHRQFLVDVCAHTPGLIGKFHIPPNPVDVREGLDKVLQGWEEMKAGKVSGRKLVYHV